MLVLSAPPQAAGVQAQAFDGSFLQKLFQNAGPLLVQLLPIFIGLIPKS